MMPVPRRSPHSISHPGLRRVSRIKGRTHVSTRPRATPLLKISLAPQGASTHVVKLVFQIPSLDRAPSLSFDPPTPRQPRGRDGTYTAATGARYTPPLASSAQTIRAIVLASATRTSIGGLRASMRPSHEPAGTPLRAAQRATALAPMISKRRSARSPILEVLPSRSLPPLER